MIEIDEDEALTVDGGNMSLCEAVVYAAGAGLGGGMGGPAGFFVGLAIAGVADKVLCS